MSYGPGASSEPGPRDGQSGKEGSYQRAASNRGHRLKRLAFATINQSINHQEVEACNKLWLCPSAYRCQFVKIDYFLASLFRPLLPAAAAQQPAVSIQGCCCYRSGLLAPLVATSYCATVASVSKVGGVFVATKSSLCSLSPRRE
jgi:hypothetical protein